MYFFNQQNPSVYSYRIISTGCIPPLKRRGLALYPPKTLVVKAKDTLRSIALEDLQAFGKELRLGRHSITACILGISDCLGCL
jgi:hypothetical protein